MGFHRAVECNGNVVGKCTFGIAEFRWLEIGIRLIEGGHNLCDNPFDHFRDESGDRYVVERVVGIATRTAVGMLCGQYQIGGVNGKLWMGPLQAPAHFFDDGGGGEAHVTNCIPKHGLRRYFPNHKSPAQQPRFNPMDIVSYDPVAHHTDAGLKSRDVTSAQSHLVVHFICHRSPRYIFHLQLSASHLYRMFF